MIKWSQQRHPKVNLKAAPLSQCVRTRTCQSWLITTAVLKRGMKFLKNLTHTMNSCKLEGRASVAVEFLSRWPAISATTSVSYKAYLSRKVSTSIVFDTQFSIIMTWWFYPWIVIELSGACYARAQLSKCDGIHATTVAWMLRSCKCSFALDMVDCFLGYRLVSPRFSMSSFTQLAHRIAPSFYFDSKYKEY